MGYFQEHKGLFNLFTFSPFYFSKGLFPFFFFTLLLFKGPFFPFYFFYPFTFLKYSASFFTAFAR